ncbi:MARVEL domain-containing protein 3-like isoform X1 [Hyperolius riggenbachi]|uniref:MARVEL domain-containing protein 3-like isoform X1 n=1 Tax=Hyperolius riggenbachi TaxID=752182 RepID=UPI0035A39F5F
MSRSQGTVNGDRIPPSQRSYNERPRRERPNESIHGHHGGYQPERERRDKRSQERLSSQAPIQYHHSRAASDNQSRYSKASHPPYSSPNHRSASGHQTFSQKCSNLCSRRGLLQLTEIILNLLTLICAAATESASAGFSSIGGFGSAYYYTMGYSMSGFVGNEVDQVAQLDVEYSRMKLPTVYAAVAITLLLLALTLSFMSASCMSAIAKNRKVLLAELVFNVVAAVIYIVCVALYIHFIKRINATDVCKQREALYNRRGYNSVTCDIQGTEMAACVFAIILIALYVASAVIMGLLLRDLKLSGKAVGSISLKKTNEDVRSQPLSLPKENKMTEEDNSIVGSLI